MSVPMPMPTTGSGRRRGQAQSLCPPRKASMATMFKAPPSSAASGRSSSCTHGLNGNNAAALHISRAIQ